MADHAHVAGTTSRAAASSQRDGARRVFTVGYEGRDLDELVEVLSSHRVTAVVDVRLNAISRKAGFSKTALAERLAHAGIRYVHERRLGNPKENRDAYRNGDPAARRLFSDRLDGSGAEALERLRQQVRAERAALLCVEREPHTCHRTDVAAHLGVPVVEL